MNDFLKFRRFCYIELIFRQRLILLQLHRTFLCNGSLMTAERSLHNI